MKAQRFNHSNIFFTSDTHFCHENVIKYCNRPFQNSDEMDDSLINNWNKKIKPNDIIFFIGDFAFAKPDKIEKILKLLNGNIYLIRGNHDHNLNLLTKYFIQINDLLTIEVKDNDIYQPIVLCHFPILYWDRQHYGSWMLHGHSHGTLIYPNNLKNIIDVGVDCNNFEPISYQEIKEKIIKHFHYE